MWARLIEPGGVASYVVSVRYAVAWCAAHPDWRWTWCDEDGGDR